jgi:sialate O-acetylesterase
LGWATAEEKDTVTFSDHIHTTVTGKAGKWLITLAPMKSGGPYNMQIVGQ